MMNNLETVYAVHNFEAENEDELSFQIGEPIIVYQKDDGYNDGWWKGQNMRGEVGIFPMNYITFDQNHQQLVELPTPSNSDSVSITTATTTTTTTTANTTKKPSSINTFVKDTPSIRNSYSYTCPSSSGSASNSPITNNGFRKMIINALFLPNLRSTPPKDWDVQQVETWLNAMKFESMAENFRDQEITGDILLELNMESLKELDIPTFGKRFKLFSAIQALREELGFQSPITSNTQNNNRHFSDIPKSPTATSSTKSVYNKNSTSSNSYHSSLHQNNRKSYHSGLNEEDQSTSPVSVRNTSTPQEISPITPSSTYDIMEINKQNYESRQNDIKSSISKRDMAFLQQGPKQQTILPMSKRSSMDIACNQDEGDVTPDMEGWLYKQGCKYKKWNKRWFVLKGPNLFYFKSPKDARMKGIINLRGYRIIPDETIQPGKYSFKAQHEEERTFFFYTDTAGSMRAWITSLMKATISRDFSTPVLSSSMIPTVSLEVARRMRPRPPSAILYNKKDEKLTFQQGSSSTAKSQSSKEDNFNQDSGFDSNDQEEEEEVEEENADTDDDAKNNTEEDEDEEISDYDQDDQASLTNADYIKWVNDVCSTTKISSLQDLKKGDVLIEILEELSGKPVRQHPPSSTVDSISMVMLDNIVAAFKFMNEEGVEIDDMFTVKDIYGGNEERIKLMLESISKWSVGPVGMQ